MSTCKAYHITAEYDGKKFSLLTLGRLEIQVFIHDHINASSQVIFTIRQYETNEKEFLNDLKKLTSEVLGRV